MPHRRIAGFGISFIVKVTLAAVIGILFFKFIAGKVGVPALQMVANAV